MPSAAAFKDRMFLTPLRVSALEHVEALEAAGWTRSAAVVVAGAQIRRHPRTIWRWLDHAVGVPRSARADALRDRRCRDKSGAAA